MDRQNGTRISRHGRLDDRQPTLQERRTNAPLRHSQGGASRARPLVPEAKTRRQKQPPPNPSRRRQQHGSIPQHPASAVGHSTNGLRTTRSSSTGAERAWRATQTNCPGTRRVGGYRPTLPQNSRAESPISHQSTTPTARSRNSQTSSCATPRTGTSRTRTAASGTPFGQSSLRHRPNGR